MKDLLETEKNLSQWNPLSRYCSGYFFLLKGHSLQRISFWSCDSWSLPVHWKHALGSSGKKEDVKKVGPGEWGRCSSITTAHSSFLIPEFHAKNMTVIFSSPLLTKSCPGILPQVPKNEKDCERRKIFRSWGYSNNRWKSSFGKENVHSLFA